MGSDKQSKVSILMYHFVREQGRGMYPGIKGVDVKEFKRQVDYYSANYDMVSVDNVMDALSGRSKLPDNAALFTFDDGYLDHFVNVFPILKEKQIQGVFFPSAAPVLEGKLLDDDKVQLCIGATSKTKNITESMISILDGIKDNAIPKNFRKYYDKFSSASQYDDKDTVFIKCMLQRELPIQIRTEICKKLFDEFVGNNETQAAKDLYMNIDQLIEMRNAGMHIGGHGYSHKWTTPLSFIEKTKEIDFTVTMLDAIGSCNDVRTYAHPHGDYDTEMIALLKNKGFKLAFAAAPHSYKLESSNRMFLPRFYPEWNIGAEQDCPDLSDFSCSPNF